MANVKKFKLKVPLGNIVIPKEEVNEQELRDFAVSLVKDGSWAESWKEKAEKDPIQSIVEWLRTAGYEVNEL